jgi:hypothetical protein
MVPLPQRTQNDLGVNSSAAFRRQKSRYLVQAVTGVFASQADAQRAVDALRSKGISFDKIALLTPGSSDKEAESVPVDAAEGPGMGKAIGAVVGGVGGFSGGTLLLAAIIPGVGPVTAVGLLGAAILGAAGATAGAAAGETLENSMAKGLPEDEIFVYEDALRKGRTVVIAIADDSEAAEPLRELMTSAGAESVDAAREQWWIGLRSSEREHYAGSSNRSPDQEKYYRLGFEAALHARTRCKEFDQVSGEMNSRLEEVQQQHPGVDVSEAFLKGYQRGRDYYQRLCDESKAA